MPSSNLQEIVILGGGFSGLYTALELEKAVKKGLPAEITLIDKENFFLFTPMLHEVASSSLGGISIANPLRKLLRYTKFIKAEVVSADLKVRKIFLESSRREISYDHVVLALGAVPNFFGNKNLEQGALTMKSLHDGIAIRNRIISCLEQADSIKDKGLQKKILTFVVAGGGFTGVETMGAVDDLAKDAICWYPNLTKQMLRMVLIHPGDTLLPEMDQDLGVYTQRAFEKRGIEIKLNTKVVDFSDNKVGLSTDEVVDSSNIIWTAGNTISPVVDALGLSKEKGRVIIDKYFQVPDHQGVWALGDCAYVPNTQNGGAHPPTAQHATREAKALAQNLIAEIKNQPKKLFTFQSLGQLANIGGFKGVASIFGIKIKGLLAWLLWRDVYLMKLPRLEKKKRVWISWVLALFFKKDIVQFLKDPRREQE
ncbi:MAG: NAD(P)/FAD-dependent oxidoreductase [Candidatus Aceula meridiana]|nr:NAD(P)/FAD-dependent oxidoreductase [Candidatus Aceula meridiana]